MSLLSIEPTSFTPTDNLLYISQRGGLVKTLVEGFSDQRPQGHVVSTDFSMDFEEKLFPLVGRDALHEYSQWTSLVKFVTNSNERLSVSSDSLCFSPFWWENLLEEVGEQWCSLVGRIGCHHGDVTGQCCHGGAKVGAPDRSVGVGARRGVRAPECQIGVGARLGRILMDAGRRLMEVIYKDPIGRRFPSSANFVRKSVAALSF